MEKLVLDTSALLHIVRGKDTGKIIHDFISGLDAPQLLISVVTLAEVDSFMVQNNWGHKNQEKMHQLIERCIVLDIEKHNKTLKNCYVILDAFSKRKQAGPDGQFLQGGARKMGKNDLWIAATAFALNATLVTTDNDFDHINNQYFKVQSRFEKK